MNILLLGQSPLPIEGGNQINAPGVRAWHFGLSLAQAGHKVHLLAIQAGTGATGEIREILPQFTLQAVSETEITRDGGLARFEADFKPDALVGASVWPSYLAALFGAADLPLWGDLFGSPLAEGQAKAALYGDDKVIEPLAHFEATVLGRADVVSGVSTYQEKALVGALATHGRLNRHTYGYRLAYTTPAAVDDQILPHTKTVLRGLIVPENAFVVLWSGGYNTWTDVDTLFTGLEQAMQTNPRIHFVSTGGALPPHDNLTYPHLQSLIENSPNRARYHLLGWLPYEGLQNYYYESDLGIILDKWSYEGVLGSRTRLLDWLKYGLPSVVTLTAELTEELCKADLAFPFSHSDSEGLAKTILEMAEGSPRLQSARQRASEYVFQNFHYLKACAPLLNWAKNPKRAPDAGQSRLTFLTANNLETEKQLAFYKSQIEAKNAQIAALEKWASEMETALKQQNRPGLNNLLNRVKRNKNQDQNQA